MKRYFLLLTLFIVNEASASAGCGGDPNAISGCGTHCGNTCATFGKGLACSGVCIVNGCDCRPGYVYDPNVKKCVKLDDCTGCGGDPNAISGCGTHCGNTCATFGKGLACPGVCIVNGCDCRPGYVYDPNVKKCVKLDDCTTQCTKPNEHYVSCYVGQCQAKTCDELGKPIACPRVIPPCKDGCICNDGYVRDKDGNCVPIDKCICDENEHYEIKSNRCQITCENMEFEAVMGACKPTNACYCNNNLVRDENWKCIEREKCPKTPLRCPTNETYVPCANGCVSENCPVPRNPNEPIPIILCSPESDCSPGCLCSKGYKRRKDGRCVLKEDCDDIATCGDNSHYENGDCVCDAGYEFDVDDNCVSICGIHAHFVECPPRPCPGGMFCLAVCGEPRCVCDDGYRFDSNGNCVRTASDPECGPNSYLDKCPPIPCPRGRACPDICIPACVCNEGYTLDGNGNCVKDCGENAHLIPCLPRCVGRRCIPCLRQCGCDDGYEFDENGICIPKCGENSHYDFCPFTSCPPGMACPAVCIPACVCDDGYTLNDASVCVKNDVCGPNEFNVSCNANCPTDYCPEDDSRAIIACDPPYPCPSGCRCKFNYLRKSTDEDECILASDCPPVNCTRPNEVWDSCPDPCNLDCCEYVDKGPIACNALLRSCQPQCVCQQGYFRNSADECVSADECRAQNCGANERYLSDTTECQLSCFDSRTVAAPPRLCAPSSGCFCNPGYLRANRDGTGDCVARKTCHRTVIGPPPPVPL